jgi:hypothetical protein
VRRTINDFYIRKTETYPYKSPRKFEKEIRFSGIHAHIKEKICAGHFHTEERAVSSSLHKQYSDSTITNCEVPWPTLEFQANVSTAFSQKKKTDRPKSKLLVLGHRKSPASLEIKVFLYKTIIRPIWTYGIELWGCASKSHKAKMERSQSKYCG